MALVKASGEATLTWCTVPGQTYEVLYKNSLTEPTWKALSPNLSASGVTFSWTDATAGTVPQRYYRIQRL